MSLTQEQRTALEKLIEEKGDEVLLFDTASFNPRNPYLRKNLRKYLGCNIIGNHYLIIKYKDEVMGFTVIAEGWDSLENQPAASFTLFALVDPEYYVWKNEIQRKLRSCEEYYQAADQEW